MPKIKIISKPDTTPKMEYGGQTPYPKLSLDLGHRIFDPTLSIKDSFAVNNSLKSIPQEEANSEMEGGESLTRQNNDGSISKFDINGKKHYEGGENILSKPGDFVFSDFKKLAIGGDILQNFGKSENSTKKYTPADLAKAYDINKYQSILNNPESDNLAKDTAKRVINNYTKKLQELAITQEATKGFPQGIPEITGANDKGIPQAKYGGYFQQGGSNDLDYSQGPISHLGDMLRINNDNSFIRAESGNAPYTNWNPEETRKVQITGIPESTQEYNWNGIYPTPVATTPYIGPYADGQGPSIDNQSPTDSTKTTNTQKPNQLDFQNYNVPYGISNADKINTFANAIVSPRIGTPIRSNPRVSIPGVTLPDERASIAALQSSAASAMAANAITGDGSRVRASNTGITGKLLEQLQGTEGQFANEKARVMNEAQRAAAEAQTKQSFATEEAKQLYNKESDTARFNYDQSMRNYLGTLGKDISQSQKNASQLAWINSMHNNSPFYVDPKTGKPAYNPNYQPDMSGIGVSSNQDPFAERVKYYKSQGVKEDKAQDLAHRDITNERIRTTSNPWNMKSNKTSTTIAPYLQENMNQGYQTGPYGY